MTVKYFYLQKRVFPNGAISIYRAKTNCQMVLSPQKSAKEGIVIKALIRITIEEAMLLSILLIEYFLFPEITSHNKLAFVSFGVSMGIAIIIAFFTETIINIRFEKEHAKTPKSISALLFRFIETFLAEILIFTIASIIVSLWCSGMLLSTKTHFLMATIMTLFNLLPLLFLKNHSLSFGLSEYEVSETELLEEIEQRLKIMRIPENIADKSLQTKTPPFYSPISCSFSRLTSKIRHIIRKIERKYDSKVFLVIEEDGDDFHEIYFVLLDKNTDFWDTDRISLSECGEIDAVAYNRDKKNLYPCTAVYVPKAPGGTIVNLDALSEIRGNKEDLLGDDDLFK